MSVAVVSGGEGRRTDPGGADPGGADPGGADPGGADPGGADPDESGTAGTAVVEPALPIARVAVDIPLAHLDRLFDYRVRPEDDAAAQPGVRVRVRFAGRRVGGYVIERVATSDHAGRLAVLDKIVSPESVLAPPVAELCRAVADRYAGTLADVLRLAVPPRHARVEAEQVETGRAGEKGTATAGEREDAADAVPDGSGWAVYPTGPSYLAAVAAGRAARAVWQAIPGENWAARLAEVALAAHARGRGALIVVADARALAAVDAALTAVLPTGTHTILSADLGPAERYRRFLRVRRGVVRIVAGSRAAVFAPVRDLGLVALFDDGDDVLAEPRAPYPHAREVLMLRSARTGAALLVGGFARTAEGALLVESGWASSITADRSTVRRALPRMQAAGDDYARGADSAAARARLSPAAFAAAREALGRDRPVLIQVPRAGYLPAIACARCRRVARCRSCAGPLALRGLMRSPSCRWCGVAQPRWACGACGGTELRAVATGAVRTAEELGRAFPGVTVVSSGGERVVPSVPDAAALVIATVGAEPVAPAGYGAALLLDGWALLGRADLRAAEETLRRWMAAAAMVRPSADGGRVVVGADGALPTVQALIRWDPAGHAEAELAARRELGFPPVTAMVALTGAEETVGEALRRLVLPDGVDVLGPVPVAARPRRAATRPAGRSRAVSRAGSGSDPAAARTPGAAFESGLEPPAVPEVRALLRARADARSRLLPAVREFAARRSMHAGPAPLKIEVDPIELG